ncbi:MAG: NAD(P)H-hydrate dehydratase [Pseudomonadota bacterium]
MTDTQVLTAAQMRDAEQVLFDAGTSVSELMEVAGSGAAEWVRRIAAGRSVTVVCGPGNNGGDGYVIARRLNEAGNDVRVIAPVEPITEAAQVARGRWAGDVRTAGDRSARGVLVDCLFGSGLSRPLSGEHALLLRDLAARHTLAVAVDLPSGVASDSGAILNDHLPRYDATLALGAWKYAHWRLPGRAIVGNKQLVPIGIAAVQSAAQLVTKPRIDTPAIDSHKYRRGLAAIISGELPGASALAAQAAMRSGAGYVKLLREFEEETFFVQPSPDLVLTRGPLAKTLEDPRISALLVGPGLGRNDAAYNALSASLASVKPTVLDADALHLLSPEMTSNGANVLATPHDGELEGLCKSFSVIAEDRQARVLALAKVSGMVICAKGPDTLVAAPDGRLAVAPPAPSWLSVAGSGDVLAGIAVSRMATGLDPFAAACEAVWLHGEAARQCAPAFTAAELAKAVSGAVAACL